MIDLIDRDQAIKDILALPDTENGYSDTYDKETITSVLEDIPASVTSQRFGFLFWDVDNLSWVCSECGCVYEMGNADLALDFVEKIKYCMECGCKF